MHKILDIFFFTSVCITFFSVLFSVHFFQTFFLFLSSNLFSLSVSKSQSAEKWLMQRFAVVSLILRSMLLEPAHNRLTMQFLKFAFIQLEQCIRVGEWVKGSYQAFERRVWLNANFNGIPFSVELKHKHFWLIP